MPDLSASQTLLRTSGAWQLRAISPYKGTVAATYTVDTTYTDAQYPLSAISGAYTTGNAAAVGDGFLCEVRTSGGSLKGITRTRYGATQAATSLKIRELSRAEIVIESGDIITVRREVRLNSLLPGADSSFAPDQIVYTDQGSNPPPIPCSGGGGAWNVDSGQTFATVTFYGARSHTVDPDSAGTMTHLWAIPSGGGAFQAGSASTDAAPTMELNVGSWLIEHTVTDSGNSKTAKQYIPVVIHNTANPPMDILSQPLSGDLEEGWSYSCQVFEDADLTAIPDGSLVYMWATKESIGGTIGSLGSPVTGRSHVKFTGYIRRDTERSEGGNSTLNFEIISPMTRLNELASFSKVMLREASPDAWSELKTLKIGRGIEQLIQFYTNLSHAGFDFTIDTDYVDYDYPAHFLNKATAREQIRDLASATDARFICYRNGNFELQPDLLLMDRTTRNTRDTILTLTDADWIGIEVTREHWRVMDTYRCSGFTGHATSPSPIFAKYPGDAPGQGSATDSREKLVAASAADLYERCGRHGALREGWFTKSDYTGYFAPLVRVQLPTSYDVFDFTCEWIELTYTTPIRGIDLSVFRYSLRSINVGYNERGTAVIELELQAETFGEAGTDDQPAQSDTSGLTDPFDIWGMFNFDPLLTPILIPSNVNNLVVWMVRTQSTGVGSFFTCTNFQTGSPTFTETTFASLSITGRFIDAQQNPEDLTQWLVLTTAGAWVVDDVWGTPALIDSDTLGILAGDVVNQEPSGYVVPRLHTHIAAPGFAVAQWWNTNAGTPSRDGHYILRSTNAFGGGAWTGGEVSNNLPGGGLFVSSHIAGEFLSSDQTAGAGTGRLLKYSAYGATGPTVLASSLGTILSIQAPHHNNSSDLIFLFSAYDAGDGTQVYEYNNGVVTEITPFLSGGVGCGFANLGVDFASTDRTRIRGVANRYTATGGYFTADSFAGSYTESDDAGDTFSGSAAAGSVIEVVAIAGDNPDVIIVAGRQGGLAVSVNDGTSFTDFSGDLPTGTSGDCRIVRFGGNG